MDASTDRQPSFHDPVDPPPAGEPWTVLRLLRWSTQYLEEKDVPDGRLDLEHLLAHVLATTRLELYLQFERPLTDEELSAFKPLLLERANRRPLQYILGRAPFRELDLQVDERVLIPRPETEELVEAVLARVREWGREGLSAVDVGTGSGAIALSLVTEGPFRKVVAIDRSSDALKVAEANLQESGPAGARVELREGDLLDPVTGDERFDVVVANLPYVSRQEFGELEPEVREWEPQGALVARDGGLELIRRLVSRAPSVLHPGGLLALEVGADQARQVAQAMDEEDALGAPLILRDLARRDRIVLATMDGP